MLIFIKLVSGQPAHHSGGKRDQFNLENDSLSTFAMNTSHTISSVSLACTLNDFAQISKIDNENKFTTVGYELTGLDYKFQDKLD